MSSKREWTMADQRGHTDMVSAPDQAAAANLWCSVGAESIQQTHSRASEGQHNALASFLACAWS